MIEIWDFSDPTGLFRLAAVIGAFQNSAVHTTLNESHSGWVSQSREAEVILRIKDEEV